MKRSVVFFAISLGLASCGGPDTDAQRALKAQLKDPDSAKFEETITYQNFKCIKYNAKNSYGGYVGSSWAVMEKREYGWVVVKSGEQFCFVAQLKQFAHPGLAEKEEEVTRKIMAVLHETNLAPADVDDVYHIPKGPCADMASEMVSYARLALQADDAGEKAEWQQKYEVKLDLAKKKECKPG